MNTHSFSRASQNLNLFKDKASISEIFSSLQGEGIHVGERQIFIRFAGCPWRCSYCDTPNSLTKDKHPLLSLEQILDRVHQLQEKYDHRTVSLTGGEPLIQTPFLKHLLMALNRLDRQTYLETSGTHPHLLEKVIDHCDIISMDVKLPSVVGASFWKEHLEFLKIGSRKIFVKMVLTSETTEEEFQQVLDLIGSLGEKPALILQPVTSIPSLEKRLNNSKGPLFSDIRPPSATLIMSWWERAKNRLPLVWLMHQMHPIWGVP